MIKRKQTAKLLLVAVYFGISAEVAILGLSFYVYPQLQSLSFLSVSSNS